MEQISTNVNELRNAAKFEISNFELKPGENIVAYFSEFPSIAGFPFQIILIEKPNGTIHSKFRQWDTEYDLNRWNNGIYNLDRLRIIMDEKRLSESDSANLKKWFDEMANKTLPDNVQDENALILDGSDWKFGITHVNKKVDYNWTAATDDIELFVPIIELMRNQHKTQNKRH